MPGVVLGTSTFITKLIFVTSVRLALPPFFFTNEEIGYSAHVLMVI